MDKIHLQNSLNAPRNFSRSYSEETLSSYPRKCFSHHPHADLSIDKLKYKQHEVTLIAEVRDEVRKIFHARRWVTCGLQLSFAYPEERGSLLDEIFELNNRIILLDLYQIIFKKGIDYHLVFLALKELLAELNLLDNFKNLIRDPLTLVMHCTHEYTRVCDHEITIESFLTTKNFIKHGNYRNNTYRKFIAN